MASTRNKNSAGNYKLENNAHQNRLGFMTFENSRKPIESLHAGNGLLSGRMTADTLTKNACDVESQLFGIGVTNLVNPHKDVTPQYIPRKSLNIMDKTPLIIPEPLVVRKDQRPSF
jgi:hypothetical protein